MPIHWTKKDHKTGEKTHYTTHDGMVLGQQTRCERVMSDIYSDETYALVWDAEEARVRSVHIGSCFECFVGPWGRAVVDATDDVIEARDAAAAARVAQDKANRLAHRVRENRERAEKAWNAPEHGKTMKVVRGRKVPQGTVGVVFWMRDGRVGLALSDELGPDGRHKDVAWVDAGYLVNNEEYPGYAKWLELEAAKLEAG